MKFIWISFVLMLFTFSIHAQTKRAFMVGISDYTNAVDQLDDKWDNIHGANDIDLLNPTLKKHGFIISQLKNSDATAKRIRNSLFAFIKTCKPGDIVYIHFSCHGQPVEDQDGDEDDGWDESIIPYDARKTYRKGEYVGENHITDDELNIYFKAVRTKVGRLGLVNVVIDACHAGSSYRGMEDVDSVFIRGTNRGFSESGKIFAPRIDRRSKIRVEHGDDMGKICILEACRSYQFNNEIKESGIYYGSLSFYVNKVLQKTQDLRSTWQNDVSRMMSEDPRLIRQNVVIETSD